jgi:small-conductance mechanosensitive channel
MTKLGEWIHDATGIVPDIQLRILISLLVIGVLLFLRYMVIRVVWNHTDDPAARYRGRKTVAYSFFGLLVISMLRIWIGAAQSFDKILGFLSAGLAAGLAIALQDVVKCLAGWLFAIWRRPFNVGDRIQIGNFTGDVIDIRPFKFSMVEIGNWVDADQSTGRVMHLPNSLILNEVIMNYKEGFELIWDEIPILITFESDWKKAKEIILETANKNVSHLGTQAEKKIREASKKYMIFYRNLTPIVYTSVKDSGVLLTLRFLVEPKHRRTTRMLLWENILEEFGKVPEIDFAYPTQRFYSLPEEQNNPPFPG